MARGPIRFKLDENLPEDAAEVLIEAGHDAMTVRQQGLGGSMDPDLLQLCKAENRALITLDLDFSDIRTYPPSQHSGLIVVRQRLQDRDSIRRSVKRLLPLLEAEPLSGHLWILSPTDVRIHQ